MFHRHCDDISSNDLARSRRTDTISTGSSKLTKKPWIYRPTDPQTGQRDWSTIRTHQQDTRDWFWRILTGPNLDNLGDAGKPGKIYPLSPTQTVV